MKTILSFLLLCTIVLEARENPFFPVESKPENIQRKIVKPVATLEVNEETVIEISESTASLKELNTSLPIIKKAVVTDVSETVNFQYIRIIVSENKIRIETKDKLKKVFIAENPKVIILNFYHHVDFATKKRKFDIVPFYEVRLGAHKKYYSFVVELTEKRRYNVKKVQYGYELTLDITSPSKY
ncbi:MAG: hypothetical protein DRG24_06585 [Epsilonproteobacteria bacterium]|nr:MAG: hypothetical protein DRG24_06585 [Campylobacterota bacterium]